MITVERIQTFQLQCPWSQRDHAKRANHFKSMPGLCPFGTRSRFNYNWKWTPATLCWVWRSWRSRFDVVGFQLQRCVLAPVARFATHARPEGALGPLMDEAGCALCAPLKINRVPYGHWDRSLTTGSIKVTSGRASRAHTWQCRLKETAQGYKRWGARSAPAWS